MLLSSLVIHQTGWALGVVNLAFAGLLTYFGAAILVSQRAGRQAISPSQSGRRPGGSHLGRLSVQVLCLFLWSRLGLACASSIQCPTDSDDPGWLVVIVVLCACCCWPVSSCGAMVCWAGTPRSGSGWQTSQAKPRQGSACCLR